MKITIPEGSTIDQIDEILTKKSLIEAGDFKKCTATCDLGFSISTLEGYLFPSTYFINTNNFSSKKFIQRLGLKFRPSSDLHARLNGNTAPCNLRISPQQLIKHQIELLLVSLSGL